MTRVGTARSRITALLAALLALAAVTSGCGGAAAGGGEEETTIRYQSYAGTVDVVQLADALGYLEGLTLEKVGDITGGPQALQALASDQVDIGGSAFFGAIAQLVATGVPIKGVVSSYGSNDKISSSIVALEESPISSAKDLVGKRIAVNTLGANAEAVLDTWFEQEGLTTEEQDRITLVPLPPLNMEQALREGQVDAASMSIGNLVVAQQRGGVKVVITDQEIVGQPYNGGAFTMREEFIQQNPETTKTLVAGLAKALQYIETHTKEETLAVYLPWLEKNGYSDYVEAVQANWPGSTGVSNPEGLIADGDISLWLDWLEKRGDVDVDAIEPADVYTNEFNPFA